MSTNVYVTESIWDGVFAADFTLEQIRQRSRPLGESLTQRGWSCLVAYDTRFMSDVFARDIYNTLESEGVSVYLASAATPLPAVHTILNQHQADCALVVTARNKSYWHNGLVLLKPDHADVPLIPDPAPAPHDERYVPFPQLVEQDIKQQVESTINTLDLRRPYLDFVQSHIDINLIRRATMTIFVDPMHGTTAGYLPDVVGDETQTMAIEINRETDPLFNKLMPLPARASLTRLRKLVRESDSHLGLAFSADGTALAVVDKNGEQLGYLEIVLLLAAYLVRQYRQKGRVIVPSSSVGESTTKNGLQSWQDAVGIKLEMTANPTVRINEVLSQNSQDLLIGCTTDGKVILGNIACYPDAILVGLLMTELVARSGGSLRSLADELQARLSENE